MSRPTFKEFIDARRAEEFPPMMTYQQYVDKHCELFVRFVDEVILPKGETVDPNQMNLDI